MSTLLQLRAIALLVLRSWHRATPRVRVGEKSSPTRGVSAALLRLLFVAVMFNVGYSFGAKLGLEPHPQPSWVVSWAALGAACLSVAMALALELPTPRMPTMPLTSPFLDTLPLSRAAKLLLTLAQGVGFLPVTLGLAISLDGQWAPRGSLPAALLGACLLFVASILLGACLGKLIKRAVPVHQASRLPWLYSAISLVGFLLFIFAEKIEVRPPFGDLFGRALMGRDSLASLAVLLVATAVLGKVFLRLEGAHELAEPVRPGAVASELGSGADLRSVERLMTRREPGGRAQLPMAMLVVAGAAGLGAWYLSKEPDRVSFAWSLSGILILQMVSTVGMQRAARSAGRDLMARPLLGALPIAPRDTLASKAAALRRSLLLIAAPACALLAVPALDIGSRLTLGWRLLALWVAAGIYASAATHVAFLTIGLGAAKPRGGMFGSLESFLLLVPFAGVVFAPGPGTAALTLGTLAALSFEARRAALRTVDWFDDPDAEHGTEVWKALVVFAGFQGAQLLALQLGSLLASWLSPVVQAFSAYLVAGVLLWLMTQREQIAAPPAQRAGLMPLGLAAGAFSAGCAWLYLRLLAPSGDEASSLQLATMNEMALAAVATIGVAPLVEERFFRGWLQPALEQAMPERGYAAPLLTSLAFAAVHPAHAFVPVLVLGLLNGFLMWRFRSLAACVVAHVVHNAAALYLAL